MPKGSSDYLAPLGDWGKYRTERPYQRRGGRRRRPNNSNDVWTPTLEGAGVGTVVGGVLSSSIQTYDHGMWDADPKIVAGGMIVGAFIGALFGYGYGKRRSSRW